jgi:hypothetical protein
MGEIQPIRAAIADMPKVMEDMLRGDPDKLAVVVFQRGNEDACGITISRRQESGQWFLQLEDVWPPVYEEAIEHLVTEAKGQVHPGGIYRIPTA